MSEERYVSWEEIKQLVSRIAKTIEKDQYDLLLAIAVGGLVPTALFSKELGMKNVTSISARSYEGQEQKSLYLSNFPEGKYLENASVLIIDDIVDSGKTVEHLINLLLTSYKVKSVDVASIFVNEKSSIQPKYFGEVTNQWIVFPWER